MGKRESAEQRADEIDRLIIEKLQSGQSFRVEAGAGAGKTFSLMKVIDWLESHKKNEFAKVGQHVACITYTNAAVDVIKSRLKSENFIQPCTIHNFAWGLMKRFQSSLIRDVDELGLLPDKQDGTGKVPIEEITKVSYELGVRYARNGELFLYHDDVIKLFVSMLDKEKFRSILAKQYPIILIDEYQDSFRSIMNQFLQYFINPELKPQFGLFGDAWQTIYSSMGACGEVRSDHISVIKKEANFRSQEVIVNALNNIRPELPQMSAIDENDGRIYIITTNNYRGLRHQKGYYKGELPDEDLYRMIDNVRKKLNELGWAGSQKCLMLTHKLLAKEQHYDQLLNILGDHLRDADDEHFLFFMNKIEPIYKALADNNPKLLFEALGIERKPVQSKAHKIMWKQLKEELAIARENRIIDVLRVIEKSELVGIPDKVNFWLRTYKSNSEGTLFCNRPIKEFYEIQYSEVLNAIEFQKPDAEFSTDHGVKGEEYDNILFVMGRGWNNYKFDEVLYRKPEELSGKDYDMYIRNRNLFYVCCSRARKNLAIFITVPVGALFRKYLSDVFGEENIIAYKHFMEKPAFNVIKG